LQFSQSLPVLPVSCILELLLPDRKARSTSTAGSMLCTFPAIHLSGASPIPPLPTPYQLFNRLTSLYDCSRERCLGHAGTCVIACLFAKSNLFSLPAWNQAIHHQAAASDHTLLLQTTPAIASVCVRS
jgi:hypothetical protein